MKLRFDLAAELDLANQLGFLIDNGAASAARRLEERVSEFLELTLAIHPRIWTFVGHRELWEIWVPGTRLVLWYRFESDELQVVRVWHAAQDRFAT